MPLIPNLSLTVTPATALYSAPVPDADIRWFETDTEGGPSRQAIVFDFNQGAGLYARDLGTTFSWPTSAGTILYVWQPSLIPQPESVYGRATDWDNGGVAGNKYIQGIIVEADTSQSGTGKTFQLQSSDDLSIHPVLETPATFTGQTEIAFSCEPFLAHMVRVVSSDGVPWRLFNTKLVFQPWPEATLLWQTELTSLGITGWAHAREMNIAHLSTADLTLVLTFDAWPTITLVIPNSGGVQNKTKITLPPNKWKLMGLQIYSTQKFNLFAADLQLKVKQWGSQGEYQVLRPFGGKSSAGALV